MMAQPNQLPITVAQELIEWIMKQPFYTTNQQPNYAVGLTANGNVIISKAGGVTEKANGMPDLRAKIQKTTWFSDNTHTVYLAQKYSGDGSSNHGEMCVLAAADTLHEKLVYILCTGDNCPACFTTLQSANIATGNKQATGTQSGWAHPRGRMQLGTQLGSWNEQIAELKVYNGLAPNDRKTFKHVCTQGSSSDPVGTFEKLI